MLTLEQASRRGARPRPSVRMQIAVWKALAANALVSGVALTRLLVSSRSHHHTELWVGDSHAQHFNSGQRVHARLFRGREGQFIYHHGPRLMYSIATRGFDARVVSFVKVLAKLTPPGRLIPIFVAGEIDVRCHLVPQSSSPHFSFDFVDAYVARAAAIADLLNAPAVVLAVHPPSSPMAPDRPDYPVRGSGKARLEMSERLRAEVRRAVKDRSGPRPVLLLDATSDLADAQGALLPGVTDDWIHTNSTGVSLVRRHVRSLLSEHAG